MQIIEAKLVFSISDLANYLLCPHLTQLERNATLAGSRKPRRDPGQVDVLVRRGLEHEAAYLDALRNDGMTVVEFPGDVRSIAELMKTQSATVEAMRMGIDVIYQGCLFDGRWLGRPDMIVRVPVPGDPDAFTYEIEDTKLACHAKAAALLQVCAYSHQLGQLQDRNPAEAHLVLGDMSRHSFPLRDYAAYFRAIRERFEDAVLSEQPSTYPDPVEHCAVCRWGEACDGRRRFDDHLSLVAGMRRDQIRKLGRAAIGTLTKFAEADDGVVVQGIGGATLARLQDQSRLQLRQREDGRIRYELLHPKPARGLALLPEPTSADLFFDIEGDPFVGDDGLEYLLGVVEVVGGAPKFHSFWAHTPSEEKHSFERFIDFVMQRRAANPDLHVFHYAPYEKTALRRLSALHGTREREVDSLLRAGVLVDLFQVVRQGIRASSESYSLKKLEPLYMPTRDGDITDAGSSIVAYEEWLQTGEQKILDDIGDYNRVDCESTWLLRDWLERLRVEAAAEFGAELSRPAGHVDDDRSESLIEVEEELQRLIDALCLGVPDEEESRDDAQRGRWLLAQLLGWHRREAKTEWWNYFARLSMSDEELSEDAEAIGGLTFEGVVGVEKRSVIHRYRFDANQQHKFAAGDTALDPRTEKSAGTIVDIDGNVGVLDLKRGKSNSAPHPTAVMPGQPINTTALREAIARVAAWVVDHDILEDGPFQAVRDLLVARSPRVIGHTEGEPLTLSGESTLEAMERIACGLEGSCLPVQGPPGTGKTYAGARAVLQLIKTGRAVGITATSHKAIANLLAEVMRAADAIGIEVRAIQKAPKPERLDMDGIVCTDSNSAVESALESGTVDVVAGSPWLFARSGMSESVDTLFVDEAGQMSLANAVAVGGSARNIVLLGDPGQLAQPSQGVHPPGSGCSALEHLLGDASTIPVERGLFLNTSYRLHPDVCGFISEAFYEQRLKPAAECRAQRLASGPLLGGTGLRFWPSEHRGNRNSSPEEAELIAKGVDDVLGREWTSNDGNTKPITLDDILIVAPYNAQVSTLRASLPAEARIGTVDKFQGQEAPVVFYSLATSTPDDIPRGMDFLFSLNRLNVALSRARCLAVLVCSPELLRIRCRSVREMKLANALSRVVEFARTKE